MTQATSDLASQVKEVNQLLEAGEPSNISFDTYSGFTGYKPQYIVDAMNEVFGIGGWGFEEISNEIAEGEKAVLVISQVRVFLKNIDFHPSGWGQARITKGDIGDARKGAQTDAIKKALSYFSIGNRAYQGLLHEENNGNTPKQQARATAAKPVQATPEQRVGIDKLCLHLGKKSPLASDATFEQAKALIQQLSAEYREHRKQAESRSTQPVVESSPAQDVPQAPQAPLASSELDKLKKQWAEAYHILDKDIEDRWLKYKVHILGKSVADPDLKPYQVKIIRDDLDQHNRPSKAS
jgi:hypothetical protein